LCALALFFYVSMQGYTYVGSAGQVGLVKKEKNTKKLMMEKNARSHFLFNNKKANNASNYLKPFSFASVRFAL
jgi:hypothetical protein